VLEVASHFLRTISWNFVASGLVFTCSGMFQAMGNTMPALIASGVRVGLFTVIALWTSRLPGFQVHWIWRVSVLATTAHAIASLWLLRIEAERKLARVAA
jgi:Na+-driven multidrug efflux pump